MDSKALIESFSEFARQKNIDRPTIMRILEEVFRAIIRKHYENDENFDVIINVDKGDLEIWRNRTIVDDNSEDIWDHDKISLSDAQKIEPDFEVGEAVAEAVKLEDFGRRIVQTARQTLIQKVKDLEKENLFAAYKDKVGDIISAEVYQITGREILLNDPTGNDLIMPRSEQIPKDRFRKGDTVRAIVHRVEMLNGTPRIILSRTSPVFLERLFEQEVPEVFDGLIGIRKIVREPGERAKVAVESYDDRIDPVGACVGMKGSRIHTIVRELENENIDVINYTTNTELFISRALSPAKIGSIKIDEELKRVSVYLKPEQVSLAIGKGGQNIKLAGRLIGMEIDVFRENEGYEEEDDIPLEEFDDEIDQWVIDELKRIGLDTAKSVLAMSRQDLVRRTELEEETVDEVFAILKSELDTEEANEQNKDTAEGQETAPEAEAEPAAEAPPVTAEAEPQDQK
ncbi:MAG: transcription termination factor NusA [Bacteroidota bacterium]